MRFVASSRKPRKLPAPEAGGEVAPAADRGSLGLATRCYHRANRSESMKVATPTGFEGVFDEYRSSVTTLLPSAEQVAKPGFWGSDAVATVRRSLQRILLAI